MSEKTASPAKSQTTTTEKPGPTHQRADFSRGTRSPFDQLLAFQQTIGNQAVGKLFQSGRIQAKLKIGAPNDSCEQEADHVAERVMRMSDSSLQRKPACTACASLSEEEPLIQKKAADQNASSSASHNALAGHASIGSLRSGGEPLPEATRSYFEPRFGQDFSSVRIRTDSQAAEDARSIQAKAFTFGNTIAFNTGEYAPESNSGQALLAHELTHVVQQSSTLGPLIQRQPGPGDPSWLTSEEWLAGGGPVCDESPPYTRALQRDLVQGPPALDPEIMGALASDIGNYRAGTQIRRIDEPGESVEGGVIAAARTNIPGLDQRVFGGASPTAIPEELQRTPGTSGGTTFTPTSSVAADHAEQVALNSLHDAIQQGLWEGWLTESDLEGRFVWMLVEQEPCSSCASGIDNTSATPGILSQFSALYPQLTFEVRNMRTSRSYILQGGGSVFADFASTENVTPAGVREIMQQLRDLQSRRVEPPTLSSFAELRRPDNVRALEASQGHAFVNGVLYRATFGDTEASIQRVNPMPILLSSAAGSALPLGSAPLLSLPQPPVLPGQVQPPVLNLRPSGDIMVGGQIIPPSATTVQVGDLVAVGGRAEWLVFDTASGTPIAGVFTGGQIYRVVAPGGSPLTIDATTGRAIEPTRIMIEGRPVEVVPEPTEPPMLPPSGLSRLRTMPGGTAGGAIGVGAGLIAVANDILAPLAATMNVQRSVIRRREGQIDFWAMCGADPDWAVWDTDDEISLPPETATQTGLGVFTNFRYPYVRDIHIDAFTNNFPMTVQNFQEFTLFLQFGMILGAIRERDGRYYAVTENNEYDITDVVERVRTEMLLRLDDRMRTELAGLPESSRSQIFRLRSGSSTQLFRAANGQAIRSAEMFLGPNPWVRTLGREEGGGVWSWFRRGHYSARVLVAPANGDTLRLSVNSAYAIYQSIEDTLEEVQEGGREIISRSEENGRLEGFVAGTDGGDAARFGITRYMRYPDADYQTIWTIAFGELKQFWVDADELEPVNEEAVTSYQSGE